MRIIVAWNRFLNHPPNEVKGLSPPRSELSLPEVKEKWNKLLPVLFVVVFALSRIPNLMPANFSVAYAFAFCAGVYFRGATAWWLPLGTMLATDVALNFYYQHANPDSTVWSAPNLANLAFNYAAIRGFDFSGPAFQAAIAVRRAARRRLAWRNSVLSHHKHGVVVLQPIQQSRILENSGGLDHCAHQGHGRLSVHLGIFPQHAFERRAVHRAVCRGGKIDRARRIARRQDRRRARAGK